MKELGAVKRLKETAEKLPKYKTLSPKSEKIVDKAVAKAIREADKLGNQAKKVFGRLDQVFEFSQSNVWITV